MGICSASSDDCVGEQEGSQRELAKAVPVTARQYVNER